MKTTIRTPEDRFIKLTDYPFRSHYVEIEPGLIMHYVDEGHHGDPVILLLHGEPSWSYLYRKMIPVLVKNGLRAIAPDLIGFGKSDKLLERSDYSYQSHLDWLSEFIVQLGLENITLFCQDWGGLLGLRVITEMDVRFVRVIASNTFLPTGQTKTPEVFLQWRAYSQHSESFDIGKIIDSGTVSTLSEEVKKAYNAPFPSEQYKAGARIFPLLVPIEENDPEALNNQKTWVKLKQWEKPFLTIFGDADYIMKGAETIFQKLIPGASGQDHSILHAGHFIQEDKGEEVAELVVAFCQQNPIT